MSARARRLAAHGLLEGVASGRDLAWAFHYIEQKAAATPQP